MQLSCARNQTSEIDLMNNYINSCVRTRSCYQCVFFDSLVYFPYLCPKSYFVVF